MWIFICGFCTSATVTFTSEGCAAQTGCDNHQHCHGWGRVLMLHFCCWGAFSWTEILVLQPELVHLICHWRVFGKETSAKSSRLRWRSSQLGPKHQLLQWVHPVLLSFVVTLLDCVKDWFLKVTHHLFLVVFGCENALLKHSSDDLFQTVLALVVLEHNVSWVATKQ